MNRLPLLFFLCTAALCARPADAQRAYSDGGYVWSETFCPVTGTAVTVLKVKTGYFTDPNEPYPKTGDIAYVRAVGENISPCVNDAFGPDFGLPDGASLAISATNPVYCFLGEIGGGWSDVTATACLQTPSVGNYGGLWFGYSNLPPGWYFEVRVPVLFNKKLSGLAGPSSHRLTVGAPSAYPPYNLFPYQPVTVFYQAAFQNLASSGVTSSAANLAFDLKSYYHAGLLYVDFGTTNPPPLNPSSSSVPDTALSFPITSSLTGLNASTPYFWRARFVTSDGTFTSPVQTFTTSGATGSLSVTLAGLPPGSSVTLGITGPDGFNTTPTVTTGTGVNYSDVPTGTYTVTAPTAAVGGSTYLPDAPSQNATVNFGTTATINVTYTLQGPANVVAAAITPTSVSITWEGTLGTTYEVLRLAAGGVSSTIGSSLSGSLTDTTAGANTAYLYKVRTIAPTVSLYSAPDLATTVIFTDPSLVVGTPVKAAHITELRTAVDAVRALAVLTGGLYTDLTLSQGVTPVRAAHVTNLRSALVTARSALLLPPTIWPIIQAGTTTISAADINALRAAVR